MKEDSNPILDEMLANEESVIKELSTAHELPASKLRSIIANIKTSLDATDYSFPDDYAIGLMWSAFECLPKKEALEFLESDDLTRQVQKPMLFEALVNEFRSQLSIEELLKQCTAVKKLLETHKDYIIQTGLLPARLKDQPWLESFFLRFYDTKKTTSKYPSNPPKAPFTFVPINPLPALKSKPCKYEEAIQIEGLSERDEIKIEELRPLLFDIAIDVITLIERSIKGASKPSELESEFIYAITRRIKNRDLACLFTFDQKFSTDKRVDFNLNKPLVINNNLSSHLQSDGLLSNLTNLVVSIKHEFFENTMRQAFANPKYETALKQLKEAKSSPYLGSSYFESLPTTSEMVELLNLVESKGETLRSNRALSIKLINKKLIAERKKKRKRLITKAIAPNCKNPYVFNRTEVDGSSFWDVKYRGKVVGGKPIKNSVGYKLIRELLTNPGVRYSVESLHKMILSDYVPSSLGPPIGTETPRHTDFEVKAIASDKKYFTPHKRIAKQSKVVADLSNKLQYSTLTQEDRENTTSEYHKQSDKLKVLEDNAPIFKLQNDRVRKQIIDSMKTLNGFSTELWKHLDASIKKENGCWVYDPEKPIDWI